jgi:hypothetical protein
MNTQDYILPEDEAMPERPALDFLAIGAEARVSAADAHGEDAMPGALDAWLFVVDNPEAFLDAEELAALDAGAVALPPTPPFSFRIGYGVTKIDEATRAAVARCEAVQREVMGAR